MKQHFRVAARVVNSRLILTLAVSLVPAFAMSGGTGVARATAEASPSVAAPVLVELGAPGPAVAVSPFDGAAWQGSARGNADPEVFALALQAVAGAVERGAASDPATLTVIDFSQPSTSKRMWVYDLRARRLLFEEHVAHGRNSGDNRTRAFSNVPDSNQSSLGLYRTAEGYIGKHGYSLRLDGLEAGFNDRARERAIVIHGADYVNAAAAAAQGRLGRSLGCPAVRPDIATPLIDAIKGGGLVFAYYPDANWLSTSAYLN